MARSDSWVGLSSRANEMVSGCPRKRYAEHTGLCNVFGLYSYHLARGREVREVIQTYVWSSGPSWFLTLQHLDGSPVAEADWSNQEIADEMGFEFEDALPTITEAEADLFASLEEGVLRGQVHLHWSDEEKFERWRKEKEGNKADEALTP